MFPHHLRISRSKEVSFCKLDLVTFSSYDSGFNLTSVEPCEYEPLRGWGLGGGFCVSAHPSLTSQFADIRSAPDRLPSGRWNVFSTFT